MNLPEGAWAHDYSRLDGGAVVRLIQRQQLAGMVVHTPRARAGSTELLGF